MRITLAVSRLAYFPAFHLRTNTSPEIPNSWRARRSRSSRAWRRDKIFTFGTVFLPNYRSPLTPSDPNIPGNGVPSVGEAPFRSTLPGLHRSNPLRSVRYPLPSASVLFLRHNSWLGHVNHPAIQRNIKRPWKSDSENAPARRILKLEPRYIRAASLASSLPRATRLLDLRSFGSSTHRSRSITS